MIHRLRHALPLLNDRRATTAFEYALIVAFIALAITGTLTVIEDI